MFSPDLPSGALKSENRPFLATLVHPVGVVCSHQPLCVLRLAIGTPKSENRPFLSALLQPLSVIFSNQPLCILCLAIGTLVSGSYWRLGNLLFLHMENQNQKINTDHSTSPMKGTCPSRRYDGAWMGIYFSKHRRRGEDVWPKPPRTLTTHTNSKIAKSRIDTIEAFQSSGFQ